MRLFNDTPFVAQSFEQASLNGALNIVVVARATYVLDLGTDESFWQVDDVHDAHWHDGFVTTDNGVSLIDPGDMAPFKPATDVTVTGTARSGEPKSSWPVALQIGAHRKVLRVHGERHWEPAWKGFGRKTFAGWRMTKGAPTTAVPLVWDLAFGGRKPGGELHEDNPVGMGILDEELSRKDQPIAAPQIEAAEEPISDWKRNYAPAGLAPIAPWWGARRQFLGSYGETWRSTNLLLLPHDFKYDFWQAAPAGQRFRPWLFGNEIVTLSGLFTKCDHFQFRLPLQKIYCLTRFADGMATCNIMFLDGVHLRVDDGTIRLRLSWRASFPSTTDLVSTGLALIEGSTRTTRTFGLAGRTSIATNASLSASPVTVTT